MSDSRIDLTIGLVGDDHVLSLFNIQTDDDLKQKFQMVIPAEWSDVFHIRVKNYGVVGDTTQELLKKLNGSFIDTVATMDYALVLIGTNDVLHDVPMDQIVENLRDILSIINKSKVTPIFCTLLPISREDYSQTIADINSMMTIFCAKERIKVFDINIAFNNGEDMLEKFYDVGDGIHLTQDGIMLLADNLLLRVREVIAAEFEEFQEGLVSS
nr:GDSL-type esterase/lipase family protein [Candidatus Sigynarchaeum springense]